MAWNHRARVIAIAVAIQTGGAGAFVQPNTTSDIMAAASIQNSHESITAQDPTATGAVWEQGRIVLGKRATVGATIPLRGPGGASPPAANAWVPGRIFQSAGWAEIRKATASTAALAANGTSSTLTLANTESSTDDFLLGAPIQQAAIGSGFRQTSMIADYVGSTRVATVAETIGSPPASGANYTIPAYLSYLLGTLTSAPPLLSISVWRDKKRYDYEDWAPTSLAINVPVANNDNTSFPDMTFAGTGKLVAVADDTSPQVPSALLAIAVPPARAGKFYLDRVQLGHQTFSFTQSMTVGAASNQNQDEGQDGSDILSGTRQISLDLNQMAVSDFDIQSREDNQTVMNAMSTWGTVAGNRFGLLIPSLQLDPMSPGERNGYVSLTGNAITTDVDKSAAFTVWW